MDMGTFLQQLPLDASEDLIQSGMLPKTLVPLSEVPKYAYLMQREYISRSECYAILFGIDDPTFKSKHVANIYQEVFYSDHLTLRQKIYRWFFPVKSWPKDEPVEPT